MPCWYPPETPSRRRRCSAAASSLQITDDKGRFDAVEAILTQKGSIAKFENENGKIKGRMMVDIVDPPSNLNIAIPDGNFVFGASFDFYDCSVGMVLNPKTLKAGSGIWVSEQKEGAEPPSQEWIDFFVETLVNHIEPDGSFGYPMFTFATDTADMTVVPTKEEE